MSRVYDYIQSKVAKNEKMLAVLLDPEKCVGDVLGRTVEELKKCSPDFIFIGGSSKNCNTESLLHSLKPFHVPKILFPGDASQFTPDADALLFLSLLSGRNTDYLIGQHVRSALEIKKSGIEVIPTGYVLIDGGKQSAVRRVSQTSPIAAANVHTTVSTAVAGEMLGMKLIYLEAGSGALNPVSAGIISSVKKHLDIPLIVGGGIRTATQLQNALQAGADLVVVGNLFETAPEMIGEFVALVKNFH